MLGSVLVAMGDGLVIPKMKARLCTPGSFAMLVFKTCTKGRACAHSVEDTRQASDLLGTEQTIRDAWQEFSQSFPDHPLPRLVFAWAPLEAGPLYAQKGGYCDGMAWEAHPRPSKAPV